MACPGLVQAAGDDVVSWQTAFWSIVAIATNSMLQNNGMVLSFPSEWGFALRSSPIFCLFDGVDMTLTWFLFVLLNADSPILAAKRVARLRFRDVPDERDEQSSAWLSRHLWILLVVFVLSVLQQSIKLFAMEGIAGTQICAAFYLSSWSISQILIFAAGRESREALPVIQSDFLADLENNGLPFRLQLRVLAVFMHCCWFEGCLFGFERMDGGTGATDYPALLTFLRIVIGGLMPFILAYSDLIHLIYVSADRVWSFRFCTVLIVVAVTAWNRFADAMIVRFPFRDWPYCGFGELSLAGGMVLTAFTPANRSDLFVSLSMTYLLTSLVIWFVPIGYEDDKPSFFLLAALACVVVMCIVNLPDEWVLWIQTRLNGRIRRPPLLPKRIHILFLTASLMWIWYILSGYVTVLDSMAAFFCVSVYETLRMLKRISNTNDALFSPTVAGTTFVTMNGLTILLWYWQFWPMYWPDCTVKPAWTNIPFG